MKPLSIMLCILLLCGMGSTGRAQVNVSPGQTAALLAQRLAGPGITVLNPVLTCAANANGSFVTVSSNLGLDSGIVLTTGRAATAGSGYGVNGPANVNASTNNGQPGDAQLSVLTNGATTYDACRLEFDLVPRGDSIQFEYVFGSEEYNSSTCGNYNDAFAFFISGPGITGQQNIALVPGTAIPVAVNSINSGVPGSQGNIVNCTSMGAGSPFTAYYVDNTGGATITYKGFTQVLRAASAVTPCSTYHLKITIADAGNGLFDSGVFIRSGSLKTTDFSLRAKGSGNAPAPYIVKGCNSGSFVFKRSQIRNSPQTLRYIIAGTAQNGVDYAAIADSVVIPANDSIAAVAITGLTLNQSGPKTLKLYLLSPYSCGGSAIADSAAILIYGGLYADVLTPDTLVCEGASFPIRARGEDPFTYSWSPASSLSNPAAQQPVATPLINTTYVLTASWPAAGCIPRKDSFRVTVSPKPIVDAGPDQSVCEGSAVQLQASVQPPGNNYAYRWTGPKGFTAGTAAAGVTNSHPDQSGEYRVTVTAPGCPPVSDQLAVQIKAKPAAPVVSAPIEFCLNSEAGPLPVAGSTLHWYNEATGGAGSPLTPQVSTAKEGSQVFYVSQIVSGCESDRAEVPVRVVKCCEDFLFIPSAFSPNGDGRNDLFRVLRGGEDRVVSCRIFNRWGQQVFAGDEGNLSWDGTISGQPAEMGTYYFLIQVNCGRGNLIERKGEIMLVR